MGRSFRNLIERSFRNIIEGASVGLCDDVATEQNECQKPRTSPGMPKLSKSPHAPKPIEYQ